MRRRDVVKASIRKSDNGSSSASTLDFFRSEGQMGQLMRAKDWAGTPLGPAASWPQSLKTAISLILNSQHPMWIGWGPEMTFLYNDAYLNVLGTAKHPWALGIPAAEVWAEIWDVCGPLADKVFREGAASFVDDVRLFMRRGDFLEETYYSFSYSPIRDESGNVGGLFCPSTDVTPKVLNARRLRTLSELSANALIEKSTRTACASAMATLAKNPDDIPFALLYLLDSEGHAVLEQTAHFKHDRGILAPQIVDITAKTVANIAWPIAEVFHSSQWQRVSVPPFHSPLRGAANQPVTEAIILPVTSATQEKAVGILVAGVNPTRRLDNEYQAFFELTAGHVGTAIQNARAVEEEKIRADRLAEIDRAKTVFFSNVSHEFRTPLTLLLSPLEEILANGADSLGENRQLLELAQRNGLRLQKLVNTLLEFSRLEAGRIQASYAPTDLSILTADLASNFRAACDKAGLRLIIDCPALPEPVYVDRDMWEKIVLNLVSNAFKFTLKGEISVRLRSDRDYAVLEVRDTGTGIPEEELPKIFERFHRVEGIQGRTQEGTGIGLALVNELARLHGGSVHVESTVGQGSAFTVRLPSGFGHLPANQVRFVSNPSPSVRGAMPFIEEALQWIPNAPSQEAIFRSDRDEFEPQPAGISRHKILIADDNADMRDYLVRILGRSHDVVVVNDGQEALAAVRAHSPDLIVADVMMPSLDGFGLIAALRSDPNTVSVPVILLSARAGEEARSEGMAAGADDYLVKPFSARELLTRVSAHLSLAQARREVEERSKRIVESITDGFLTFDSEWRFTYVNAEAERLNGMRRDEMLGKSHWEVFPEAVGTTVYNELTRAMTDRVPVDFENYYAPWDRWFHVRAYPALDGGLSVFFEDISARKRAEAERDILLVREREAREEAETLNGVAQALAGELDIRKLLQKITDAATKLTGAKFGAFFYNLIDERGESYMLYTLCGAPREAFEKFGMPRNTPIFHKTFSGHGLVRSDDILKHPDYGKWPPHYGMPKGHLPVRSYLSLPVKSRSGQVLGGLFFGHPEPGIFSDRTERLAIGIAAHASIALDNAQLFQKAEQELAQRKHAEEQLREYADRIRFMAESMPQKIFTAKANGDVDYFNQQWMEFTGLSFEQIRDWGWTQFVHPDDLRENLRLWQEAITTGQPFQCIHRFRRGDGEYRWHLSRARAFRDAQGRILMWIGSNTDIHEQKDIEESLRHANADLEQFAYSASHDLQEPLRGVSIYSELLAKRFADKLDGQALQFLQFMRGSATRMEMLVRDLLAYTQATKFELPEESADAQEALRNTLENLNEAILEANAQVTSGSLPSLRVHSTHLNLLFQNLVGNAIKYRSPDRDPVVRVSAERQNGSWLFSITDNGIGIEPEYKERIFGLFKRLHTGDEYSGTGIGLAICQRIVERYHGRIWVESEPGQGSCFRFTFPC